MEQSRLSPRRRALLAAAGAWLTAFAAPAAGACVRQPGPFGPVTIAELSTESTGDTLVVSGRVVGRDCRPLAGALVELWNPQTRLGVSAKTDIDGRFSLSAAAVRGPVQIRVTHNGRTLVV